MNIKEYTLKEIFDQKKSPCLSFHVDDISALQAEREGALHRSDYFQVVLLKKGSVEQHLELNHFYVGSYELAVIFPHQINALKLNAGAQGILLKFDEVLFCSDLLKNELISYNHDLMDKLNHVKLAEKNFEKIYNYGQQILDLFQALTPIKKEQIRFYIKIMLLEIIEAAHQNYQGFQGPNELDNFARFKQLIEAHFKTNRTVSFYTDELQLTSKKLNEICKKKTGNTALNVIHERILTEIKRMLLFSGKNNKEIAYELGFDSPSALNKFVYAKLKETPSELKASLSQIYKS